MGTWWIDKPFLLGSRNPTDADLEHLRQEGFSVLVSLLMEDERPPGYDAGRAVDSSFTRHSIPVKDFHAPTFDQLEQFVGLIEALSPGAQTIVHCEGGTGRTGTFAAAYWVAKGLTAPEAIARVRKARPQAIETPEQEAVLGEFASRHRLDAWLDEVSTYMSRKGYAETERSGREDFPGGVGIASAKYQAGTTTYQITLFADSQSAQRWVTYVSTSKEFALRIARGQFKIGSFDRRAYFADSPRGDSDRSFQRFTEAAGHVDPPDVIT